MRAPTVLQRCLGRRAALAAVALALALAAVAAPRQEVARGANFTVTTNADSGAGSLRDAITSANSNPGADTISFSIGSGVQTIALLTGLPTITEQVTLDATTQPGYADTPLIELDGSAAGGAQGIDIAASDVVVRGFAIGKFTYNGIYVNGADATIDSNYLGLSAAGAPAPNSANGIYVTGSTGVLIGADDPAEGNVIAGNSGAGIYFDNSTGGAVRSNYIGTNRALAGGLGNTLEGISINDTSSVAIGGGGVGNVIANNGTGIAIYLGVGTSDFNAIRANSIYGNSSGIFIDTYTQGSIAPPSITGMAPPQGTACASCWIDVFSDSGTQGQVYAGSVQADGAGNWKFYGRVDGPNVTATATDASANTSAFSGALAKPACSGTCAEGLWHVDYIGTSNHYCTTWVNQSGSAFWGHLSCTDVPFSDYTGTISGLSTSTTVVYPGSGATVGASGTLNTGGPNMTTSGTWACTFLCGDSGTYTGTRYLTANGSTPAGTGGTINLPAGVPQTDITIPSGGPAVTVEAVTLSTFPPGGFPMRTGYDFKPNGTEWTGKPQPGPMGTPVKMTVTFSATTDLPPSPNNDCNGLAQYVQDEITLLWTWAGYVECLGNTFTTSIDSFSVHGFFIGIDTDGDLWDDGYDGCPTLPDPLQIFSDEDFVDLPPTKAFNDWTWPNSDLTGDLCDADGDLDNDGLSDSAEATGCGFGPTSATVRDTDGDRVLDGAECQFGTNPNNPGLKPTVAQCAAPGGGQSVDADADKLLDYLELCFYNSSPASANTDDDRLSDAKEVASINQDWAVNVIDMQQVAQNLSLGAPGYITDFDMNKDGTLNVLDLQFVGVRRD